MHHSNRPSHAVLSRAQLESLLAQCRRRQIALLGDLFLDRYLDIDAALDELSVETGLTAYQVARVRNSPGALGTVMNNLANAYHASGRLDEAVTLFDQALVATRKKLGEEHPGTLLAKSNLAGAYQHAGQLDKALPLYEQAVKAGRRPQCR